MGRHRFAVVGAGIIGLATARELVRRCPDASVTVLEKEPAVGLHQTSRNSGVVHAGLYYRPGSSKAQLCLRGRELMKELCAASSVRYEECGKVVVAVDGSELHALRAIESRARANGVPGLRWLSAGELREVEPNAAGVAALYSPLTAVADFAEAARAMACGLDVRLGFEVGSIRASGREIVVGTRPGAGGGEVVADHVVLCAGLQSDRVARLAGDVAGPAIVPFRGDYWSTRPDRPPLVRGLVYPVPDPRYPFLGVHFTRRVGGTVDIGPNAVVSLAREGYRRGDFVAADVAEMVAWPGFRRMAWRHRAAAVRELRSSFSRRAFFAAARRLVPALDTADVKRGPSGVRAQAVDAGGWLVDDFRIHRTGPGGRVTAVRNAPSPGATSSLAIAEHVVERILGGV